MRSLTFASVLLAATGVTGLARTPRQITAPNIIAPIKFPMLTFSEALALAKASEPSGEGSESFLEAKLPANIPQQCARPETVVEWRNLNDAQRRAYVNAERCLYNLPSKSGLAGATNRHEDLQALHQIMTPNIHKVGQFLPWHRYFLKVHEILLRKECGYNGPMTWWDEIKDAGNFRHAPMMTPEYFGTAHLVDANGDGPCLNDGAFANIQLHIGPGDSDTTYCLSRGIDESVSTTDTANYVGLCNSYSDFAQMQHCSLLGPHALGHNAIGGIMLDVFASPGDPLFFLHHYFIDRNWHTWQRANPNARQYAVSGHTTLDEPATGWQSTTLAFILQSMNINAPEKISDVMDITATYLCYKYDY